jgi:ketosteroid isomerase-like protein
MSPSKILKCLAVGCTLVFTSGCGVAADASAKGLSLEARLQQLEDVEAIRVVLDHYIELNESRDYPAYAQQFARDGELVLRTTRATGPAGILKMMQEQYGTANAATRTPLAGSVHVLSNVQIHVKGDTATASSRWTLLVPADGDQPRVGGTGRYADKLVRENGAWKFKQRIVLRDIPGDAQAAPR